MKIQDRPEYASKLTAFTLPPNALLSDAIKTMAERNIGSVVVDSDNKVKGIVTVPSRMWLEKGWRSLRVA